MHGDCKTFGRVDTITLRFGFTVPSTTTPYEARSNALDTSVPTTTANRMGGNLARKRLSGRRRLSAAKPIRKRIVKIDTISAAVLVLLKLVKK